MTLQSLRKHRITRSSTTPAIIPDSPHSWLSRLRWLAGVGITGFAVATGVGMTSPTIQADDAGRTTIQSDAATAPQQSLPPASLREQRLLQALRSLNNRTPTGNNTAAEAQSTGRPREVVHTVAEKTVEQSWSDDFARQPTPPSSVHSLSGPIPTPIIPPTTPRNEATPWQTALPEATVVSQPPAPLQTPQVTSPGSSPSFSTDSGYTNRMNSVLGRPHDYRADSYADYWHQHSVNFVARNRHLSEQIIPADEVRQFIDKHTYEELPPQDFDTYDATQHLVETGPVRTVGLNGSDADNDVTRRLTRDLTSIQPTLAYALQGVKEKDLPDDFFKEVDHGEYVPRQNNAVVLQWAPTNLWHHPLYFEDPALERYGHTYHPIVQPFASTGRFMTQLAGLPYQMSLHPALSRQYPLGWYRPGEYAPKKTYQIPFNQEATTAEAAAVAGLILLFP